MKKARTSILFVLMVLFFININYSRNTLKKMDSLNLAEMIYLSTAQAEGSSTCSVDCGDGTTISLTCNYSCVASSTKKAVRCFDENNNMVEESLC